MRMTRSMLSGLFVALLIGTLVAQNQVPVGWAVITGQVLDSKGEPVADANISLFPAVAFSGGLPYAKSDKNGFYRLVSPPFGKVWLSASKPSSGYPDTNSLLFAPEVDDRPELQLSPGSETNQDIHLAAPDGILEAKVIDGVTKAVVQDGRITMRRQKPASFYSTRLPRDGHFLYALPAAPIEITVSAPGYQPWSYRDAKTGNSTILLSSSDRRILTIELTPVKSGSNKPAN